MLNNRKKRDIKKTDFFSRIKRNPLHRKKILRRILFLILLSFVFYIYFGGDYGFFRLLSLKRKKESIILETKRLQAKNMDLEIEKEKFRDDRFYIEKVARERYGMAKKDEIIYKFVLPKDTSSTPLLKENR